ncbi:MULTISPECIES: hypothetical protein [Cellulophaga]|uniref:DUF4325 domain-containing protein n=1 Tax=Cellulophaga lytica (strain ATCC 23178 / DSM 7489 / JCM 8516 / NBRC 14961 / NCIMB 1423 / VKM B-1433 / Cy l20) TaxID=867900 RepID=F0REI7_CELLC|nr:MULTISPECIES: hypothetical protein [Cellulophaga]ADY31002.1 hypothetical protein Celly_3185 [Cellulophaga lytica DSM 7489]WBU89331.1 hypothetical protein PBN93_15850 [Cellulophaga omnivescoria]WQG78085.1 hypothetical protein SR888_03970 [Cellulophaga lytica]
MKNIDISLFLNNNNAISHSQGTTLYEEIKDLPIGTYKLSFINITRTTTSFLNASIGKLAVLNPSMINSFIFESNNPRIESKINSVLRNAKNYHSHDENIENALLAI